MVSDGGVRWFIHFRISKLSLIPNIVLGRIQLLSSHLVMGTGEGGLGHQNANVCKVGGGLMQSFKCSREGVTKIDQVVTRGDEGI